MSKNKKTSKRRFGRVRQLPSGRWQARYSGPDGVDRPAPETFATKTDADIWLTKKEAEILNDDWIDPDAGKILLSKYGRDWIDERPNLRPRTVELYGYLFRNHLVPTFGERAIAEIKDPQVRRWRKTLLDAGVSAVTVAKAYRLLKAIMTTAVDDLLIKRNPCRIKGAGQEKSPERPILSVAQVFRLADVVEGRYRALILMATFAGLRWGELAGLQRQDIDMETGVVRVRRQLITVTGQGLVYTDPKSEAGKRMVAMPGLILDDIRDHLKDFTLEADDALVFIGPDNGPLRNVNFNRRVWSKALADAELPKIHFHDLRHTGNTLAANAGASTRDLMKRMGHSSSRAALIYQHSTDERQREIADKLDDLARRAQEKPSGTQRARKKNQP
ncbi:tyrosine-type recombinase/integrase [Herbidospora sp. NBRC 101105]|uniref:tyrosine-type recombinase/integrase n=1 Tax=Herbidospora sp. NBRC 101105 TaxID=3032195 RepID=UPI0024A38134|nr:tyrosine-type recombinase/integrase [Herbidospora sp. NBRC 101105]GLX96773.1 putative prophage phiRv2 integrase [Herbidospora sp. NBRC 101105]